MGKGKLGISSFLFGSRRGRGTSSARRQIIDHKTLPRGYQCITLKRMAKKSTAVKPIAKQSDETPRPGKPSALLDTRVVYCGDNLEQLAKLPDKCVDLIYIDPPFNSNRNYEVFWGETKEKRSFEDRHASTQAYIEYMGPRLRT